MIICPSCQSALREEADALVCTRCSYRAERANGMILFNREIAVDHEDYRAEGLDALYAYEKEHFWFKHRLGIIRKAFRRFVGTNESVIEVGAGTGHTARALLADGYDKLAIGEIHRNGLEYARGYGVGALYQFDLRTPPFADHFDAVVLFDVLEHLRDDDSIVANLHRMLRKGGRIILTVPAHAWLWSRIDELSSHHRRYGRKDMTELLERHGFEILERRFFFTALVPALWLRARLARQTSWESIEADSGLKQSRASNALFMFASVVGDALLWPLRPRVGGSLLVVARKRD